MRWVSFGGLMLIPAWLMSRPKVSSSIDVFTHDLLLTILGTLVIMLCLVAVFIFQMKLTWKGRPILAASKCSLHGVFVMIGPIGSFMITQCLFWNFFREQPNVSQWHFVHILFATSCLFAFVAFVHFWNNKQRPASLVIEENSIVSLGYWGKQEIPLQEITKIWLSPSSSYVKIQASNISANISIPVYLHEWHDIKTCVQELQRLTQADVQEKLAERLLNLNS